MATGRVNFFRAFLSSALGTGLSRILGAVRDRYMAQLLGAGAAADAWHTAFTIPSMMRKFVADEGLTGALLPALAKAEAEEGPEAMAALSRNALGALVLANVGFVVLGIVAAEPLVYLFAPSWGDDPEKRELAVTLTRWMMPFLLMVSVVSYAEGLLNYRGHFFVPKIAPGIVSLGFVLSVILLGTSLEQPAYALVVGLLVGGAAHVLVNVPVMVQRGVLHGIGASFGDPRLRHVVGEMGKVVLIGAFAQINVVVLRQIATALPTGTVTQYTVATRLVDLAQGMVAVAVGSALLPNVSAAASSQDWDTLRDDLVGGLRLAAFMLLPAAVVISMYALPTTSIWFRTGRFTYDDVQVAAVAVALLAPHMLALGGVNIIKKAFFALEDRRTLLVVGGLGVVLNGVLGWALSWRFGLNGLVLTLSISTSAQLVAYLVVLHRSIEGGLSLERMSTPLLKMGACLVPVAVILWAASRGADWTQGLTLSTTAVFLGGLFAAAGAYLVCAWLLGLHEVTRVTGRLLARFGWK